jgi:hypothetical protein
MSTRDSRIEVNVDHVRLAALLLMLTRAEHEVRPLVIVGSKVKLAAILRSQRALLQALLRRTGHSVRQK